MALPAPEILASGRQVEFLNTMAACSFVSQHRTAEPPSHSTVVRRSSLQGDSGFDLFVRLRESVGQAGGWLRGSSVYLILDRRDDLTRFSPLPRTRAIACADDSFTHPAAHIQNQAVLHPIERNRPPTTRSGTAHIRDFNENIWGLVQDREATCEALGPIVHMIIALIEWTNGMIKHMTTDPPNLEMVPATRQPDLRRIKALVLDSLESPHSRRAYDRGLTDFLSWYAGEGGHEGFTKSTVQRYSRRLEHQGLSPSTRNVRLTAVRRLAAEAADNGLLPPELAAGIGRVKGAKQQGTRTGNWLTVEQAEDLLGAPQTTRLIGKRDRALLAVLIGCGLRRSEISELTFGHVQQRDGRWALVDIRGKGGRMRTVPMPSWVKVAVDEWGVAAGLNEGRVFRSMNNRNKLAEDILLPQNIMEAVEKYGRKIGIPRLAPHDLRRTFAKLAHKGRAALEQIQLSLGHASIVTTERYLGVRQDLQDAPCDHLGIRMPAV